MKEIVITTKSEYKDAHIIITPTEFEILKDVAEGMSSKEISQKRHISFKTVEVHRHNILKKTKFRSAIGLIVHLFRTGFLK